MGLFYGQIKVSASCHTQVSPLNLIVQAFPMRLHGCHRSPLPTSESPTYGQWIYLNLLHQFLLWGYFSLVNSTAVNISMNPAWLSTSGELPRMEFRRRHAVLDPCGHIALWIGSKSYPQVIILRRWQKVFSRYHTFHQLPLAVGEGNVNWRQKELWPWLPESLT